ncbi:MAPEG family protein [Novosphingobium sp.]|uniref:MAPEG family protein n=1 Tax=Novosphingobium sp. TaxID=1874826 RepID=UPI0025F8B1F7|nr:MAPEG family protein [Novosphingobium sp.]MCC6924761.1 MAPEG family protein [Novosphingobium sp.]
MELLLPTTLCMAAAAALINFWLALRCGQVRAKEKVSIGSGGNELLERRMRAQLNFAENTPWVLALVGLIELAGKGGTWLPYVAGAYLLARIGHGLGMDGGKLETGRGIGVMVTMLSQIGLAVVAIMVALGKM